MGGENELFISLTHIPGVSVHDSSSLHLIPKKKTINLYKLLSKCFTSEMTFIIDRHHKPPEYLMPALQDPINFLLNILYNSEIH